MRLAPGATIAVVSGLGGRDIRNQDRCLPTTPPYGCGGEWASIYSSDQGANFGALFCTFGVGGKPERADCYFKDIDGNVPDTFSVTSEVLAAGAPVLVDPAAIPFGSPQPYADESDVTWVYDHGAPGFSFHFAAIDLEDGFDFLEIRDGSDQVLETVSGSWPSGYLTMNIPTGVGKVRLVSDQSLTGTGFSVDAVYSFGQSVLAGTSSTNPTSLQFGPDGRLHVAQEDGFIRAYTVVRNGPNAYAVTATETISAIRDLPNHDDADGALNAAVTDRQVTGILVEGTAANPVLYVSSSDPRNARVGPDPNGDTNSGVLSRLTWNGSSWDHLPLVRGLPRSHESHAANGLVRDPATNTLYLAQGGHTNQGAPYPSFTDLPEYAFSGAVLAIDLTAIGDATYDLPTLDDPGRAGDPDATDPFGGNGGANQAILDPSGPVQVYSPGFRNPYDLVRTAAGRLYVTDNGPNADFGGPPAGEGPGGSCTASTSAAGTWAPDGLHYVASAGY